MQSAAQSKNYNSQILKYTNPSPFDLFLINCPMYSYVLYYNIEKSSGFSISLVKIYFSKRKVLKTVNKTTASQNVEQRHKSRIITDPSLDVGHGILESRIDKCHVGGYKANTYDMESVVNVPLKYFLLLYYFFILIYAYYIRLSNS